MTQSTSLTESSTRCYEEHHPKLKQAHTNFWHSLKLIGLATLLVGLTCYYQSSRASTYYIIASVLVGIGCFFLILNWNISCTYRGLTRVFDRQGIDLQKDHQTLHHLSWSQLERIDIQYDNAFIIRFHFDLSSDEAQLFSTFEWEHRSYSRLLNWIKPFALFYPPIVPLLKQAACEYQLPKVKRCTKRLIGDLETYLNSENPPQTI